MLVGTFSGSSHFLVIALYVSSADTLEVIFSKGSQTECLQFKGNANLHNFCNFWDLKPENNLILKTTSWLGSNAQSLNFQSNSENNCQGL